MKTLLILLLFPFISFGVVINPETKIENHNTNQANESEIIINILVKSITKEAIYSQDGRIYKISENTKIIKNYKNKPMIAELHFQNNKLIVVILK